MGCLVLICRIFLWGNEDRTGKPEIADCLDNIRLHPSAVIEVIRNKYLSKITDQNRLISNAIFRIVTIAPNTINRIVVDREFTYTPITFLLDVR